MLISENLWGSSVFYPVRKRGIKKKILSFAEKEAETTNKLNGFCFLNLTGYQ